jgi:hypothetical protein
MKNLSHHTDLCEFGNLIFVKGDPDREMFKLGFWSEWLSMPHISYVCYYFQFSKS